MVHRIGEIVRVPLSRYSIVDLLIIGGMLLAASVLAWLYVSVWLAAVFLVIFVFLLFFFRDPARKIPAEPGVLVSPADGKIVEIDQVDNCPLLPGAVLKIAIFMSVFNAHVIRAPADGTVASVNHKPGKFYNALRARAAADNESNSVVLNCPDVPGQRLGVKQIAGVLARRIVCGCKPGERLARGQAFGMIKFGSRVELYLPYSQKLRLAVSKAQKVKAGSTILVRYDPVICSEDRSNG